MSQAGNAHKVREKTLATEEQLKSICTIGGTLCKHFDGIGSESHAISGYFAIRCSCGLAQGGSIRELNHWRAKECGHRTDQ